MNNIKLIFGLVGVLACGLVWAQEDVKEQYAYQSLIEHPAHVGSSSEPAQVLTCIKHKDFNKKRDGCVVAYEAYTNTGRNVYVRVTRLLGVAIGSDDWELEDIAKDASLMSDPYRVKSTTEPIDSLYQLKHADGFYQHWYTPTQIADQTFYQNGVEEGLARRWWRNGQLNSESYYKNGLKTGTWQAWHENGTPFWQQSYDDNGQLTGRMREWDSDGALRSDGMYVDGKKHGLWLDTQVAVDATAYGCDVNPCGAVDATREIGGGNYVIEVQANYNHGVLDGLSVQRASNDKSRNERMYQMGLLISQKIWNEAGVQILEVLLDASGEKYHQKNWHDNGQLAQEGDLDVRQEKHIGVWQYWNLDGHPIKKSLIEPPFKKTARP